jgi:hypothetical protein
VTVEPILGKPVSIFPVFVVARSFGLCEACWPVSDSLQVRECAEEGESSWKEPCSCQRTRRLSVQSVPITQGKGDWQLKDCPGDREGALSWGGTGMWESGYVGSESGRFLGEHSS